MNKQLETPFQVVLQADGKNEGSATDYWPGGLTNLKVTGNFHGASACLETRGKDSKWTAVREVGPLTTPVFRVVGHLPEGEYRVKIIGGSRRASLSVLLKHSRAFAQRKSSEKRTI